MSARRYDYEAMAKGGDVVREALALDIAARLVDRAGSAEGLTSPVRVPVMKLDALGAPVAGEFDNESRTSTSSSLESALVAELDHSIVVVGTGRLVREKYDKDWNNKHAVVPEQRCWMVLVTDPVHDVVLARAWTTDEASPVARLAMAATSLCQRQADVRAAAALDEIKGL